jgi:hypothetical protein
MAGCEDCLAVNGWCGNGGDGGKRRWVDEQDDDEFGDASVC